MRKPASVTLKGLRLLSLALLVASCAQAQIAIDKTVSFDNLNLSGTGTTPAFSTTSSNELLLAMVEIGASNNTVVTGVSGCGLAWSLVRRTNAQLGDAEIWTAFATTTLSNCAVTETTNFSVRSSITVITLSGASSTIGATMSASAASGAPSVSLTTTRSGSWVFGNGNDPTSATARTLGSNQTMVHQYLVTAVNPGKTDWVQRRNSSTSSIGTTVTLNDTAPTADAYNMSAVEVLPVGYPGSCTSTATIHLPATLPFSGLTGANTLVSDPEPNNDPACFHNPILRLTDANTSPSNIAVQYLVHDSGAAGGGFNAASPPTKLSIQIPGGTSLLYLFTASPMHGTRMYGPPGWTLTGTVDWSQSNPDLFYSNLPLSTVVQTYDTSRSSIPDPQFFYDFKSCTGIGSNYAPTWVSPLGISKFPPDHVFTRGFSNVTGGQDTGVNAAARVMGVGCYDLNTQTGTVSGPSGVIGTVDIPDRFTIHEVSISKDGNWMVISENHCLSPSCSTLDNNYFWQIGTTHLLPGCTTGHECGGHGAVGTTHAVNTASPGMITLRLFSDPSNFATFNSQCPTTGIETHPAWPNDDFFDLAPISESDASTTTPFPSGCWNEIDMASPSSTTKWRIAHTYNAGDNQNFSAEFSIHGMSNDGNFVMWPSDMMHSLGSTSNQARCSITKPGVSGDCRTDIFIVQLR